MAYTSYNENAPDGSTGSGSTYAASDKNNQLALRDMVEFAQVAGVDLSISGGTNEEPAFYIFTRHGGAILGRATPTWSGGKCTALLWEKWNGASYDAVLSSSQVITYDANLEVTATTNAGGMFSLFFGIKAKLKKVISDLAAHAALTGTNAHGNGTMAAQNANAVATTGGSLGCTYEREAKVALGNVSASTPVDWNGGGLYTLTVTGASAALTWTNLPSGKVGYMTIEVTNGAIATNLFTAKKPGGTAISWTNPGLDVVTLRCSDGVNVYVCGFEKDSK